MTAVVHQLAHVFFFPIVNQVGDALIFLGLTRYCTDWERHGLALLVAVNGFFLLLGSLRVGSYALELFGSCCPSCALPAASWSVPLAGRFFRVGKS
jgi:small neutral amino acid transporter SnatA (MarC family)